MRFAVTPTSISHAMPQICQSRHATPKRRRSAMRHLTVRVVRRRSSVQVGISDTLERHTVDELIPSK